MGYILTLASAVFYYRSFSPGINGYLTLFSLIPFFFSLLKSQKLQTTILIGSVWGITLSSLFSIPLFHALLTEYQFSIFFSSVLIIFSVVIPYGIIYGFFGFALKYFFEKSGIYFSVFSASLWIIIDYIMSITPVFMPWGFAGYSQVLNPFIQISDISGIYGVSFLIILINALFTGIFISYKKNIRFSLVAIFILIISCTTYGNLRIININKKIQVTTDKTISAAVIQGNFSSKEKWNSKNSSAIINTYINLTKQVIGEANIILWPETVLNSNDVNNLDIISGIASLLKENQIFITGATRNDDKNNTFNSIFTSDKFGLKYIYDKKILFPFTESTFAGLSSGNYIDSPSVFNIGKTKTVLKSDIANIGFTICFESIYPEYVRKIKNNGADILINVANDSWFGNTYEPEMHLYSNISRAIENRIYVVRASNSGISAIISPTGQIMDSIDLNTRDKAIATIQIVKIDSFYSQYGDWIIVLAMLILILFLAMQLKRK